MTRIFLARHGQTEWNLQNRLQGHHNSPLTETGRKQAGKTAEALGCHQIDRVYSSPLQRALDTARIIVGEREIEIVTSAKLKEINLGPWEGRTREQTRQSHPLEYDRFWNHQGSFQLSGAETYHQLQQRVVAELDAIFAREQGRNILVVSHWIAIKSAVAHYSDIPITRLKDLPDIQNGRYLCLEQQNGLVAVTGL